MKKEDIINEIISKNVLISTNKNFLQLFNSIDISMYGSRAWAATLQRIGLKKNKKYLFESGYLMGKDSALELKETFDKKKVFLPTKFQLLDNIIEITGFGIVELKRYVPKKTIELNVIKNPIIEYGKDMYGEKSLICNFYAGVYSGFIDVFLDIEKCRLVETSCICKGNKKCSFRYNAK